MDLIISHNGCPDGWCAAYIAKVRYPEAEILLLNHGIDVEPVLEKIYGKDVLMTDYSLRTRELNDRANELAKSFRILDHHESAERVLAGAPYAYFDMKRSGAGLTWDFLFGYESFNSKTFDTPLEGLSAGSKGLPRPWWVNYTEDQDLWNWKLEKSQEVNAYLMTQPRTIEAWDKIIKLLKEDVLTLGEGARAYIEYYTRSVVAEAQSGTFNIEGTPLSVKVLNVSYVGVSEAGNALAKQEGVDVAVLWFERGDGIIQFSLRGTGKFNCSKIAQRFGGGGHQNAAGFQLPLWDGRALMDKILGRDMIVGSLFNG